MKNKNDNEFEPIFITLKNILKKYEKHLTVTSNNSDSYNLNAGYSEKFKRDIYFGGVQKKKNYVSFYLMPVYINPKLLEGISPDLRKRMQGKSCFNFKKKDQALFIELSNLTKTGFEFYKRNGIL